MPYVVRYSAGLSQNEVTRVEHSPSVYCMSFANISDRSCPLYLLYPLVIYDLTKSTSEKKFSWFICDKLCCSNSLSVKDGSFELWTSPIIYEWPITESHDSIHSHTQSIKPKQASLYSLITALSTTNTLNKCPFTLTPRSSQNSKSETRSSFLVRFLPRGNIGMLLLIHTLPLVHRLPSQ